MGALSLLLGPSTRKCKLSTVSLDQSTIPGKSGYRYTRVGGVLLTDTSQRDRASCTSNYCIVISACLLSLSLNIAVGFYLCKHINTKATDSASLFSETFVATVHESTVCTSCTSVGVHPGNDSRPDLHDLTVHYVTDSTSVCCLENVEGLQRLLAIFTDRIHDSASTRNQGTHNNDSAVKHNYNTGAHMYLDSDALTATNPSLAWTDTFGYGSAYRSSDISCDNNTLRVTRPGLYHIYSFFTFKTRQRRRRPDNILNTMRRSNTHLPNLGSTVILMAKKTMPEAGERFVTSFLSATVRLRQDDGVFVDVSNTSYIYKFPPSSFFGLYFVGT
ncbi:uncharacterized protein LOC124125181 [Haliotis rufescens]|uniref:uncharacterized protein LOC124125181 n=1 Tax=Haliotis rufescens TaxID=6454 RepID=UPI00201F5EE3|nr:uncharacterized protein LOC124125181 [Haliotis rufescens]